MFQNLWVVQAIFKLVTLTFPFIVRSGRINRFCVTDDEGANPGDVVAQVLTGVFSLEQGWTSKSGPEVHAHMSARPDYRKTTHVRARHE